MQTSRNKLSTWISGIHGGQWGKEPVFTCQPDNSSLYNIIYSHAHIWLYKAACHWDSSIYGHIWTPMRRKPEGNRGRKNKQQLCIIYMIYVCVYAVQKHAAFNMSAQQPNYGIPHTPPKNNGSTTRAESAYYRILSRMFDTWKHVID